MFKSPRKVFTDEHQGAANVISVRILPSPTTRHHPEIYLEAKNSLGALYAKLGRNAEAVALFEEAVEDSPQYPQPYLNWGLVLASQGNLTRAKEMFEKALGLSPNLAEARKALQIVEKGLKGQD